MIDLAEIVPVSEVNGPGKRAVIWVQGCPKRCAGCWNQDYLNFGGKWRLTPEDLFKTVRTMTENFSKIEGVTFSGGEPFAQAGELAKAAKLFKKENLTVMSYSGFTLEEIQNKTKTEGDFLAFLDILVDGEYRKELTCDRLWRSSLNQNVHFLTDRYKSFQGSINVDVREFEVFLSTNQIRLTGFPKPELLNKYK